MNKLRFTLILSCIYLTTSFGQAPSSYDLTVLTQNELTVSVTLDASAPGPVELFNACLNIFVRDGYTLDSYNNHAGTWNTQSLIPNASLAGFCTPPVAEDYNMFQICSQSTAILGSVAAGVPEPLFTVVFTGSATNSNVYGFDPGLGDPLSACVVLAGTDNTADIDVDGLAGPAPGTGYGDIIIQPQVFLPIVLSDFTAKKLGTSRTILNWETSSEVNGSHFEIERSEDAKHFEYIGAVDAVGNSNTLQSYEYIDDNLSFNRSGVNHFYYRLKMVDIDGSSEYSEIKVVSFKEESAEIVVFPNPTTNGLTVDMTSMEGEISLEILNLQGKRVYERKIDSEKDALPYIALKENGIYTGTYLVRVYNETTGEVKTKKFIVLD